MKSFLECSNYRFLNESNRAMKYSKRINPYLPVCDSQLSGWYRFSGAAGNQMADSCVKMYHCATDAPGWLRASHPTVAEGSVQRTVCFTSNFSCCAYSSKISVRNCGGFYVYKLEKPPHCFLRYCGNGLSQAPGRNASFSFRSHLSLTFVHEYARF